MKEKMIATMQKIGMTALMFLVLTVFMGGISYGAVQNVYLRVAETTLTVNGNAVTMWGYASCNSTFTSCGSVTVPGPELSATVGDTLNMVIQNGLPAAGPTVYSEPTSVVIPGQPGTLVPTWTDSATGNRTALTQRVRSFTQEAAVGASVTYTFSPLREGTYLYESGTHPGLQVQMGLYGALKVYPGTPGTSPAYTPSATNTNTTFNTEITLLFSEVDPAFHKAVATGQYGPNPSPPAGWYTSPNQYHPRYFLINGAPYSAGRAPFNAGGVGQRVLLRFLNAGLLEKSPTMTVPYMSLIADDGNLMPYQLLQYSVPLSAGKTIDAIITPTSPGYIPLFDRSLNLTNGAASPGGMLVYLQVGAPTYLLTVDKLGIGKGTVAVLSAPGGIDCGTICSHSYLGGTQLTLTATPSLGSYFAGWGGDPGSCTGTSPDCGLTIIADTTVTATFNPNSSTVGVFRPSNRTFYLKNANTTGVADIVATFGVAGDLPIVGDWDGNGTTTIGIFRPSNRVFFLRNTNTTGVADVAATFGVPGDIPIVGDWDGDGTTTIGVFRPSNRMFYLRNTNTTGGADIAAQFGIPGDIPIVGDWDGNGTTTIGVYRPSNNTFYLRNSNTTGTADIAVTFGPAGALPVVGRWNTVGITTPGTFLNGTFNLRSTNTTGPADMTFNFGVPGDLPLAGDWDGLP